MKFELTLKSKLGNIKVSNEVDSAYIKMGKTLEELQVKIFLYAMVDSLYEKLEEKMK